MNHMHILNRKGKYPGIITEPSYFRIFTR